MSDIRIIAVSLEGGEQLQHITHVWTVGGAMPRQRAVDDLWARRCRYYTVAPTGRIDVLALPRRGPGIVAFLLRRRVRGILESARGASATDSLLTLPRLPSPTRPRRSRAMAMAAAAMGGDTESAGA
ncbi:MAG TPA: hypothetical protein VFF72_13000 [Caldimonas sp.]|nr:hypothetical protein [Caldimonas sp.]